MALGWYINRLRAMGPLELAHRLGEKIKKELARNRLEGWSRYPSTAVTPLSGLRERLLGAPAELRHEIGEAAAAILAGRFSALGVDWPERGQDLFPASLWRLDPVTGKLWPAGQYCFDIAYRHERDLGDIKYVWEINRLQFLQPLAAHALLSGDERYVLAMEAAIESWFDANPPFQGLGWNSGIELALRAISLLIVDTLVGERLSQQCRDRIGAILHAHAFWLRRHPSRYSSANNHLVAESAGEFLLGMALPELPWTGQMTEHARATLIAEASKQILADGVPAEQSPSYGAFTAELIALSARVARDSGRSFPSSVDGRLERFAEFISWSALADGSVPAFGDDDDGRVLTLGRAEHAYPLSVACALAGYLRMPAPVANAAPDFRAQMLGQARKGGASPKGLKVFAEGGYTAVTDTINGRTMQMLFDHGPLGYLSIAAHGHADALSITLAIDGNPVLVDPGTYLYHSGGAWRDWFRGTRAHNTLTLADTDQSRISGPFNWSHKARSTLESYAEGQDWKAVGSHDGYCKTFGVIHRRTLARTRNGVRITDALLGPEPGEESEVVFQLAPHLSAECSGNEVVVRSGEQRLLTMVFETSDLHVEHGGEGIGGGWVSPSFGRKIAADRIVWKGRVGNEGRSISLEIQPPTPAPRQPVEAELSL